MAEPFISIGVKGGKALQKRLMKMDRKVSGKAIKSGMKKAMEPVLALAKRRVPVDTGNLRRSIRIGAYSSKGNAGAVVRTGTRKQLKIPATSKHYYPAYIEYGSKKVRARSYLRSSLFDKKKQVLSTVIDDIKDALEKR